MDNTNKEYIMAMRQGYEDTLYLLEKEASKTRVISAIKAITAPGIKRVDATARNVADIVRALPRRTVDLVDDVQAGTKKKLSGVLADVKKDGVTMAAGVRSRKPAVALGSMIDTKTWDRASRLSHRIGEISDRFPGMGEVAIELQRFIT